MWRGTRVLVTGGAGLIGSHIVDLLLEQQAEVTILDNLEPQSHPHGLPIWMPSSVRFVEGDLRSEAALSAAVEGAEVVFHQAAFGGFTEQVSRYLDVNATGTARLLEAVARSGRCRRVVVASSQAVYGEGLHQCATHGTFHPPTYRPLADLQAGSFAVRCPTCKTPATTTLTDESAQHLGHTPYALSKSFAERTALGLGRLFHIPTVALRYGVTYGPRQSIHNPYTGVVTIFSTRILRNLPPVVYEDGQQARDFVYVGDVAAANLFVASHDDTPGVVYNVGTGRATTVLELVAMLNRLHGRTVAPEVRSFRPGDARNVILDPSRLSRLGFLPATELATGLARTVEWMSTLGEVEDRFSTAEQQLRAAGIVDG